MSGSLSHIKQSSPALGTPLLAGCAEGVEGVAMGLVGLAGLFVFLLFALPPVMRYIDRRQYLDRMRNRRPWSEEVAEKRKERRRKDA